MAIDPFDLTRFLDAQEASYNTALSELRRGQKRSHWIWYILPQLRGLGQSDMSHRYGISGLAQAQAYLAHPVLGPRLFECIDATLGHKGKSAQAIFGDVDARKFQSCLTLFGAAGPSHSCFDAALKQFFSGETDAATVAMLQSQGTQHR